MVYDCLFGMMHEKKRRHKIRVAFEAGFPTLMEQQILFAAPTLEEKIYSIRLRIWKKKFTVYASDSGRKNLQYTAPNLEENNLQVCGYTL
jgi:hypothetical protein